MCHLLHAVCGGVYGNYMRFPSTVKPRWGVQKDWTKLPKAGTFALMNRKLWMNPQEGNLARQLERLRVAAAEREYQVVQTIAEYASSLNEKRRGMKKRLSLLEQQAVDMVLLEDPDRLVRFGFSSLQETFRWQQVRLEVLDPPAQVDPTTDLLAAMLTIVTVFSRKLCAYRAHANPRRKKALPMLVSKSEQEERAV